MSDFQIHPHFEPSRVARGPREDRKATMDVSPEALSELKQASPDAHVPVRAPQTPRAPPALFKSR